MKISAVSFVYNEQDNIRQCLESLKDYVDEILLVEMCSTDKTLSIAYEFTREIYRKPHLICGDAYKEFLHYKSKGDWLLWFYPDEIFNPKFLTSLRTLIESDKYDAYALMRHEYRDGYKLPEYGNLNNPNYQNRLHRKCEKIFYTELVHAEIHGSYETCYLPEEYWMEHHKKVADQEFDNFRLYAEYKHLIWKYRDTKVEPYQSYVRSYNKIISESEDKNRTGERMMHPAEERWWEWWKYSGDTRKTLEEWKTFLDNNPPDGRQLTNG